MTTSVSAAAGYYITRTGRTVLLIAVWTVMVAAFAALTVAAIVAVQLWRHRHRSDKAG